MHEARAHTHTHTDAHALINTLLQKENFFRFRQKRKNQAFTAREGPNRSAKTLEPTQQAKHMRAATNPDFLSKQMWITMLIGLLW